MVMLIVERAPSRAAAFDREAQIISLCLRRGLHLLNKSGNDRVVRSVARKTRRKDYSGRKPNYYDLHAASIAEVARKREARLRNAR